MGNDGLLRIAAAAAAACGVFALVTGNAVAAAAAGACSVVVAVIAGRRSETASPAPAGEASPLDQIDLREPEAVQHPEPVEPSSSEPAPVDASPAEPAPTATAQLFDGDYLAAALRGRVAVARRALRPLSVVHVRVEADDDSGGRVPARMIAAAAEATLRESDIVGRRDDGVYVVVLEDTAEDGAVWTAERLRRHIAGTIGPQRFQAGVASYPNHGLDAEAVDASAARALIAAQEWDRDRIEVAVH